MGQQDDGHRQQNSGKKRLEGDQRRRFAYRLAAALGQPSVDTMLSNLSARELDEWVAFFELEPFGDTRGDIQMAQLCTLVANIARDRRQRAYRIKDFLLRWEGDPQPALAEQWRVIEMWNAALGGKVVKASNDGN